MLKKLVRRLTGKLTPDDLDVDRLAAAILAQLSPRDAELLAAKLAPRLINTHTIWGDGSRVKLGDGVQLVNTLLNVSSGTITIEDFVFFGHGVQVLTGTHDLAKRDLERQTSVPTSGRDIVIRRGAWIASGSIIAGPCEIGAHAVVAAGSLVMGDVKEGWLYAGAPARPIRPCTEEDRSLVQPQLELDQPPRES